MSANQNLARSVARLAAVQALYQMEVSGASTADVLDSFTSGKLPRETEATYSNTEGDLELFKTLIEETVERQATLDRVIARPEPGFVNATLDAAARDLRPTAQGA